MTSHVPDDIRSIVQTFQIHNLQVTGPVGSGEHVVYHVNGHAVTENELRELATKNLLTSWEVFHYTKVRSAKRAGFMGLRFDPFYQCNGRIPIICSREYDGHSHGYSFLDPPLGEKFCHYDRTSSCGRLNATHYLEGGSI
jgi:hypothetical protein